MVNPLRFTPGSDPTEMIDAWLARPALRAMVEAYGGEWPDGSLLSRLEQLVEFSAVWDLRGGSSRLGINVASGPGRADRTLGWAQDLGLIQFAAPTRREVDAVLVLGGLVTGCVSRVEYLRDLLADGLVSTAHIALLGSFRGLQDQERSLVDEFAPGAETEVDVLMALAAHLDARPTEWELTVTGNPASAGALTELVGRRGGRPQTWLLAARSSDPDRRSANTADTYRLAADHLKFAAGTRLLIVTNQIYAFFQHWDAVRVLGLPFDVDLETIGTPPSSNRRTFGPEWYAQEVRSTLRSARDLAKAWTAR
ncbi:hypothetical protein [Actinomycetospora atypica]|uniref:Uncharacterized protein n=1 Tax=Actinomycetospora atypica TaxID=1290095 RepID=A0ABV9YJR1_9PSEU